MPQRLTGLKVFWPEVETCLRLGLAVVLLMGVLLPVAWSYRQHAEAELWHDLACAYQLQEALRDRVIAAGGRSGRPCERLARLGLSLAAPSMNDRLWPAASVQD
jgi:hypothetical protein